MNVTIIYAPTSIRWDTESGLTFRTNGPCHIDTDGTVYFSQLDPLSFNRVRGPSAIMPDGSVSYRNKDGAYHRTDGPAIMFPDGFKGYWVNGRMLNVEEFFLKYGVL